MCGIAGYLNRTPDARVDPAVIRAMTRAIAHRGPDGEAQWIDGPIGLGHRRLAIIDIPTGGQPMSNEDESVWIVFNGAIYNHVELRRELEPRHAFRTNSDTEVIIHLYEDLGEQCLDRLNGMFAFAIWDVRNKRLFMARDRLGIKPLYWTQGPNGFIFASEIKALLAAGTGPARPDPDALAEYLTYQFTTGEQTLFQNIRRLPPAHCLTLRPFDNTPPRIRRYWDFGDQVDDHHTFDYFRDRLRELLDDAVTLQLRSDVPLGAYLSGGTDSSVVTTLAAPKYGAPLNVFCGAFDDGPEYDESAYAKLVADRCGAVYNEVRPTAADFCRLMPELIRLMDEPMAGPGLFPQYCVSQAAAKKVKVCLAGQGGDELFGGYARYLLAYLEQCLKGAIYGTQSDDRYVVTWDAIQPHLPMLKTYLPMLQDFWGAGLFEDMDRRYFRLISRDKDLGSVLTEEAWNPRDRDRTFERFRETFQRPAAKSYFSRMTHFDMTTLLPALLHVEDRVSMGVGLESRVPLLDHRIAELVAGMPPIMRFQGGRSKHVLREAVKDFVPAQVLDRQDKMGFPVPFNHWLKGPIRDFVCDTLLGRAARERGMYRTDEIERRILKTGKFSRLLWGILCLELWHQQFIDAPTTQAFDSAPAASMPPTRPTRIPPPKRIPATTTWPKATNTESLRT